MTIVDTKTNKEITLRAGTYELELVGAKDGLALSSNQITLSRGGTEVVRVRFEPNRPPGDATAEIRRFEAGGGKQADPAQLDNAYGFAVGHDGRLFSGRAGGVLCQWDLASGRNANNGTSATHSPTSASPPTTASFSAACSKPAGWASSSSIRAPARKCGSFTARTPGPPMPSFHPTGAQLITTGNGSLLVIWDVPPARLRSIATPLWVTRATASADFRWGLSCSQWRNGAALWDIVRGKQGPTLVGHRAGVTAVALAPDGRRALTGSKDKSVRLWDVAGGKELQHFDGHTDAVTSVAFSAQGRWVLSGSADQTVRLWDSETGKQIGCFKGHAAKVTALRFMTDGRQAMSASVDRTVCLWRLPKLVGEKPDGKPSATSMPPFPPGSES